MTLRPCRSCWLDSYNLEMVPPVVSSPLEEQQVYRTFNGGRPFHNQARQDQHPAATRAASADLPPAGSAGHQGGSTGVPPLEGGGGGPQSVVMGGPQGEHVEPASRHVGVLGEKEDEECQGGESDEGYRRGATGSGQARGAEGD